MRFPLVIACRCGAPRGALRLYFESDPRPLVFVRCGGCGAAGPPEMVSPVSQMIATTGRDAANSVAASYERLAWVRWNEAQVRGMTGGRA